MCSKEDSAPDRLLAVNLPDGNEKEENCSFQPALCVHQIIDDQILQSKTFTGVVNVISDLNYRSCSVSRQVTEVHFYVGQGRQLMKGRACDLEAISPVIAAMLSSRWKGNQDIADVEIPDFEPDVFGVILRCAAGNTLPPLTDDTVWEMLRCADQLQVHHVVRQCFFYLLSAHRSRRRSRHICMVLETAHELAYSDLHAECMKMAKARARRIFRNRSAVPMLCRNCMLSLVTADDLQPMPEILIYDAVVLWARCECAQRGLVTAGRQDLLSAAGIMSRHVRYLLMPRRTLKNLDTCHPSCCLLTRQEISCLLKGDLTNFPPEVQNKRRGQLRKTRSHKFVKRKVKL